MKNKMFFALAASGLALAATPAFAQDETPVYFDGPYIGGTVGFDAQSNDTGDTLVFDTDRDGNFDNTVNTVTPTNAFSPGFCNGAANTNAPAGGCANDDDDIGYGARIGYDKRLGGGPIVAGLLLEGSTSDSVDYTSGFSTTPASYTTRRELDYAISGRGRLGYSPGDGRGLFYVTGGVSYAKIKHDFITTNGANSFDVINGDKMVFGLQAGAGAELMVTKNIGLGVEYLYSKYNDDKSYVAVGPGTAGATNPFLLVSGGTNLRTSDTDLDMHSLRASLSFHF